jgi:hypothetical protein
MHPNNIPIRICARLSARFIPNTSFLLGFDFVTRTTRSEYVYKATRTALVLKTTRSKKKQLFPFTKIQIGFGFLPADSRFSLSWASILQQVDSKGNLKESSICFRIFLQGELLKTVISLVYTRSPY